jgi:glutamate dehydrogenase
VLLSFAKIALTADLIHSRAPDDPGTEPLLVNYFPPALRERFRGEIESHRLRREIIVTALTNAMINRGGPAMAVRLADETGREPADVALAFLAADEIFGISALWHDIGLLDGRIGGSEQLDLYARVSHFHMEQTESLLRHGLDEGVGQTVAVHRASVATLAPMLASLATRRQLEAEGERRRELEAAGAPHAFAARIAGLDLLSHAPAITWLAAETGQDLSTAARAALAAADYLRLDELKTKAGRLSARDYYDQLAASGALHALEAARRTLAVAALGSRPGGDFDFAAWERGSGRRLARAKALLDDIAQSAEVTVSRLTVAASQLRDLADR